MDEIMSPASLIPDFEQLAGQIDFPVSWWFTNNGMQNGEQKCKSTQFI